METPQHDHWDKVAGVQGIARRVEPTVKRDGVLARFTERIKVGGLINEAAPLQLINDVHGSVIFLFEVAAVRGCDVWKISRLGGVRWPGHGEIDEHDRDAIFDGIGNPLALIDKHLLVLQIRQRALVLRANKDL